MALSDRFSHALTLSFDLHRNQIRKGTGVPYLTHLMAVCSLVGEYGGDEDLMIAALLHDSLEDCSERITLPEIVERFGWRVGKVVEAASDSRSTPKPPWDGRKRAFIERLRGEYGDVKLVVSADKLHNATTMLRDAKLLGDVHWTRFNASKEKQCWYLRSCLTALRHGWGNAILTRLEDTVCGLEIHCLGSVQEAEPVA